MNILILLPLVTFFLCFLVFYIDAKNLFDTKNSLRMSFLLSLVVMGAQVLISTEILSLFNAINFYAVLIWWIASFSYLLIILLKNAKNMQFPNPFPNALTKWNIVDKLLLSLLFFSLFFLLINAVFTPPNNWDGMTYHLPKVMHWIQNQNLDYYPAHAESQISLQAFAEYIILHTFLLTGDDYFANSVQWFSMLGSLICVSKIAQYLGCTIRGQLLTVFLLLTAPMALYQSMSVQNDLVATVWVLTTFLFFFKFKENFAWKWSVMIGLSLAMALLTKSTSYMYLLPMVVYVVFLLIKKKFIKILYGGFIISTLVVTFNAGYYVRNLLLCGNIVYLHKDGVVTPTRKLLDPKVVLSNITKNAAFNLGTPFDTSNSIFDNMARGIHKLLELDINDPTISFSNFAIPDNHTLHSQEAAPNPLLTLLLVIILPVVFVLREKFSRDFFLLFFMGMAGVLLIILLLKWQTYSTRFQIPFLAIIAICGANVIDKLLMEVVLPVIMVALWLVGCHYLYNDVNLAFKGEKNIFNTSRNALFSYKAVGLDKRFVLLVEEIEKSKCREFGLIIGVSDLEYHLWKSLRDKKLKVVMKHVKVDNITKKIENKHLNKPFLPCATLVIGYPDCKIEIVK